MALTTGRYVLPHPVTTASGAIARARTATRDQRVDWVGRGLVFPFASNIAKCKTAPTMLLLLAMLRLIVNHHEV